MESSDLLSGSSAAIVTAVLLITSFLKSGFSEFFDTKLGQRLLPVVPLFLGILGGLVMSGTPSASVSSKLLMGLMSGLSASMLFKLGKTTVLGLGVEEKAPKDSPKEETK